MKGGFIAKEYTDNHTDTNHADTNHDLVHHAILSFA